MWLPSWWSGSRGDLRIQQQPRVAHESLQRDQREKNKISAINRYCKLPSSPRNTGLYSQTPTGNRHPWARNCLKQSSYSTGLYSQTPIGNRHPWSRNCLPWQSSQKTLQARKLVLVDTKKELSLRGCYRVRWSRLEEKNTKASASRRRH